MLARIIQEDFILIKKKNKKSILLGGMLSLVCFIFILYCYFKGIRPQNISIICKIKNQVEQYNNNNLDKVFQNYNLSELYNHVSQSDSSNISFQEFKTQSERNFIENRKYLTEVGITFSSVKFIKINKSEFYDWDILMELLVIQNNRQYKISVTIMTNENGIVATTIGNTADISNEVSHILSNYYLSISDND